MWLMTRERQYQILKHEYELIDYIYYLQYEKEKDDIVVKTADAYFMVWEGSTFKVNGDECSSKEFYDILDRCQKPVECNGIVFEKKGNVYVSTKEIEVKKEVISTIIKF